MLLDRDDRGRGGHEHGNRAEFAALDHFRSPGVAPVSRRSGPVFRIFRSGMATSARTVGTTLAMAASAYPNQAPRHA